MILRVVVIHWKIRLYTTVAWLRLEKKRKRKRKRKS